jgi:hypothetical protein
MCATENNSVIMDNENVKALHKTMILLIETLTEAFPPNENDAAN